ncbi:MAG: lysine exporter LysO family protein [Firmicutes bacterium]|nr:lysine exporter LysO family protein [Bacillota bacterium]
MMVLIAVLCLTLGIVFGALGFADGAAVFLTEHSDLVLCLLMFSVGISVGLNRSVFRSLRSYHIRILIIPAGIILASVAGGAIAGALLGIPPAGGMAVAAGLGWYSLSGVLVGELFTPQLGTIAFLSNLMREILTFCLVPFVAKHFNGYTAIAPAAATSEDTTLAILMKYTNEEVVVMAVFNGVLCSAVVPVLIRFFASL